MSSTIASLLDKSHSGRRLTPADGLRLLESHDLAALAGAADVLARRLHPEPWRTYNVDRNVNYTNICLSRCHFCAFARSPGETGGYVLGREELFGKIAETIALGGNQILLQGGMNPELGLAWCEQLLGDIKGRFPRLNVHGFSPPEVVHIAAAAGLPVRTVLGRLKAAGLGSLPGGARKSLWTASAGPSVPRRPRPTSGLMSAGSGTPWAAAARRP